MRPASPIWTSATAEPGATPAKPIAAPVEPGAAALEPLAASVEPVAAPPVLQRLQYPEKDLIKIYYTQGRIKLHPKMPSVLQRILSSLSYWKP